MDPQAAQATLEQFGSFLCSREDQIVQEWLGAVQSDGRLQTSERLTAEELKDHLPKLIDNLVSLIKAPTELAAQKDADENARVHGSHRFAQGYRLDELLRELARIRAVMIRHAFAFEEQTPGFEGVVKRVALQRLHGFFDNMICDSAEQFVRDQQSGLTKDVNQARVSANQAREGKLQAQQDGTTLRSNLEELQQVDASRLKLLRTAAHELRNGVYAIRLVAEQLQMEEEPEAQRELTTMLTSNIEHLATLLNDLLDYSTVVGDLAPSSGELVSVSDLCRELEIAYSALAEEKGLELTIHCAPSLIVVESRRTKLVQIATNLLTNAIKYTKAGRVNVSLEPVDEAHWSIVVEDSGAGMAPQDVDRLFTEFHRARQTAHMEGTGLGLAIVKRLVNRLGGEIKVQSELGKGSRFEVILPRTLPPTAESARP